MAKLLKKHFGLGGKKPSTAGSQRSEYSAQKSSSAQDLIPQSPTRYHQSGVVSSASSHHEFFDTHSLKSSAGADVGGGGSGVASGTRTHDHGGGCCCKHHGCCRHQCGTGGGGQRASTSNEFIGCRSVMHSGSVAEESDVYDETPSAASADVAEMTLTSTEVIQ